MMQMKLTGLLLLLGLTPAAAFSEKLGHHLLEVTIDGNSRPLMVPMTKEDCDLAIKVILHRQLNPQELEQVEAERQAMLRFSADHRCSIMSFDGSVFEPGSPNCSFQSRPWNYAAVAVAQALHKRTSPDAKCSEVVF